jgi:hypothetical protein
MDFSGELDCFVINVNLLDFVLDKSVVRQAINYQELNRRNSSNCELWYNVNAILANYQIFNKVFFKKQFFTTKISG